MKKNLEEIVLAGGCFWCTEAVFRRVVGVEEVIPGYTGGHIKNPAYREVCSGRTGHAEGVKISYDPKKVSVYNLFELFFATHDPTTLNRQGNDVGTQYRSAIFYTTPQQQAAAADFINKLEEEGVFDRPVVTEVQALDVFYHAEEDHLEYYDRNKSQPYCTFVIAPKIKKIEKYFSDKLK
jgi:peptide-methionine (S)-S-oxide reductase